MKHIEKQCKLCKQTFLSRPSKNNNNWTKFCSKECSNKSRITKEKVSCQYCQIQFYKTKFQIKKTKNNFCSKSCAATYNNTHKTKGTRISKLEIYLQKELPKLFPNLEFIFNNKEIINSELDIYIPSLNLAFELNGIFHYEPIFGKEKLNQIKNNDNRKFQACLEHNIELCIIDTSSQKYFKPKTSKKFINIIENIINKNLSGRI